MPYVIGQATVIEIVKIGGTIGNPADQWGGITSFNFNESRSFNPLYQLGATTDGHRHFYAIEASATPTISVSLYSGTYDEIGDQAYQNSDQFILPTSFTGCENSDIGVEIRVTPGLCVNASDWNIDVNDYGYFYLTSYAYSKDVTGYGTETWNFQAKPRNRMIVTDPDNPPNDYQEFLDNSQLIDGGVPDADIRMIHGIATGTITGEYSEFGDANIPDPEQDYLERAGVTISYRNKPDTNDPQPNPMVIDELASKSLEISAGPLTTGTASATHNGFVTACGGSTLIRRDGINLNVNVTVPLTTIYQAVPST